MLGRLGASMKLIRLIAGALVCASIFVFGHAAYANCECTCVNGHVQALCQSAVDLPPLCPPQLCPLQTPSIAPIPQAQLPPLGTTHCEQAQVLNPRTGMYEWRQVCR